MNSKQTTTPLLSPVRHAFLNRTNINFVLLPFRLVMAKQERSMDTMTLPSVLSPDTTTLQPHLDRKTRPGTY